MIPVSVMIVTRNEAARLPACLAALKDFDEVLVIDSGSTDRTAAIAKEWGAIPVTFQWNGQYPKKRQYCLDHIQTRHDWIFFVDADEIVTPELVHEISGLRFDCAGYFVKGRYMWQGRLLRHGMVNNKLALFDRRKLAFPVVDDLDLNGMGEMEGHYQPILRPAYRGERIGQLNRPLIHDAAQSREEWDARHHRYAEWERGMNKRQSWPADPLRWRQSLKKMFRALPMRGTLMFLYSFIWKRGFLDGRAGYDFARSRAAYYRMIGD